MVVLLLFICTVYLMKLSRDSNGPVIVGHRGAGRGRVSFDSGFVLENSIESFLVAEKLGLRWVETDAVRTADNKLVLHHDTVLSDGRSIERMTLAEVVREGIDSLEEAFLVLPPSLGMIVEVKHVLSDTDSSRPDTALLVAKALVAERIRSGRALASYGFDASTAGRVRSIGKSEGVLVGTIAEGGSDLAGMVLTAHREGLFIVAAHTTSLLGTRAELQMRPNDLVSTIGRAHELGQIVLAWCPKLEEARILSESGVDALCVDNVPDFMSRWVG